MSESSNESTHARTLKAPILNLTVFLASACVMIVEVLSTRLVAPYLGSSLYTWTSAIGIVLAGVSAGNYLGGILADRFPSTRTLATLFVVSSIACISIPFVNAVVGEWTALRGLNWPTRIFWHFTLAFLLPATLLGTRGPWWPRWQSTVASELAERSEPYTRGVRSAASSERSLPASTLCPTLERIVHF